MKSQRRRYSVDQVRAINYGLMSSVSDQLRIVAGGLRTAIELAQDEDQLRHCMGYVADVLDVAAIEYAEAGR